MRKSSYILLFVLCIGINPKYKAQIYFNKIYDCFNNGDLSTAVDTLNGNYFTLGVGFNPPLYGFSWGFNLKKYNSLNGNELFTKTYFKNNNNYVPQSCKPIHLNNKIIVAGEKVYSGSNSWTFFWRFNNNLDSLDYKELGFPNRANSCWATLKTNDNKIYLTGYTDSSNTDSDILLIKTDTLGNEIWKKKIGNIGWDEQAYSIKYTQDNNLIIAGYKKFHTNTTSGDYIVKIDTSGSVLWDRYYASSNYASGSLDVIELPNGNYVFTGDDAFSNSPQGVLRQPTLGMLTPNGDLLWRKSYGSQFPGHDFYNLLLNKRGSIVVCGQRGMPDNSLNGIIYEVNQNGDSLFSREYYYQAGCQNYFQKLFQQMIMDIVLQVFLLLYQLTVAMALRTFGC